MSIEEAPVADEIEFLDVDEPAAELSETATTTASGGNVLVAVAALAIVAFAIAALTSNGDDAAPTASSVPSTIPSPTTSVPDTSAQDPAVVQIGGGPALVWDRVEFEVDATGFAWVDGGFLGVEGSTDYLLGSNGTLTVSGNQLAGGGAAIRSSTRVIGDGTSNPSELTFVGLDQERVGLVPIPVPESDLVVPNVRLAVERNGDRVLVLQTLGGVLDLDRFNDRVGIDDRSITGLSVGSTDITLSSGDGEDTLPIEGLDLSASDLAALRTLEEPVNQLSAANVNGSANLVEIDLDRIDWIAAVGDDFVVGGAELRRSSDGESWEPTSLDTPQFGGLLRPGPDGIIVGLAFDETQNLLTTSADGAREWSEFPSPLTNIWRLSSVAPVVAITGWMDQAFLPSPDGWSVLTPNFELRVGADDDSFELLTRAGDVLLSGSSRDVNSGFRFLPGSDDIWFVDPVTNVEIARFPRLLFAAAFAASRTLEGQPQMVGFADISQGDPVEWSLAPVNDLFGPEALAVDLVPGDGWFLADVTTTTGRELYLAEVPTATRPLSERRHPTYAEMSRDLDEQE